MQRRESLARNHQRPRSLTVEQLEPRICLAAGSAVHARPSRAAAVGIDHTPPMIVAARVPVGRPVPAGQTLPISLRFSETVRLAGLNDQKPPTLRIDFGFYAFDAPYAQGSGTRELTFALAVPAGLAGRIVGAGPISLPDGTSLSDSAGNAAVRELPAAAIRAIGRAVVDGMSPDIITIGKPTPAPYGRGTTIVVRMSEPVVVAGSPTLRSIIGGVERSFVYSGGTGTDRLTFTCSTLRTVGIDRITTEPAIRIGPGRSIRDRNGNAYGPVPIPTEALASTYFADHCRQVIASDGVLDVFLQMKAETITVGGGRYSSQDVVTVAMPESVPGFLQDTFTLLDPLLSLDYRLTSDRSRADVIIWIDSAISVENLVDPLGITIDNVSEGRAWWEIGLNGPLLQNSIALLNYVILHELGHAQGLEHTFDDYDDDFYIGTNIDTNAYADDTVMSYRGSRSGRLPAWYTQNDLAALRSIWGSESMSAAQTSGPRETRAGR